MENDSNPSPQTSSLPSQIISSSVHTYPPIPQGPPSTTAYTSQPDASNRLPQSYYNFPRPPGFPAQSGQYPSSAFSHQTGTARNPPAGSRPHNGPPPTTYQPNTQWQGDNTRQPPPRRASQYKNVRDARISHGHFPILTDSSPAEGEFAIVDGVENLDISGGQFIIGGTDQVSAFVRNTADVAERAFGNGERNGYAVNLEEDDLR